MSPDDYNKKVLAELTSIRKDLGEVLKFMRSGGAAKSSSSASAEVADDRDLDGQYGDPMIKYDPSAKYWGGESFAGYKFSECPAEYLEAMAKYLDACAFMASKDPDEKKQKAATYKRKDACRARGWGLRVKAGFVPAAPAQQEGTFDDSAGGYANDAATDDIPF